MNLLSGTRSLPAVPYFLFVTVLWLAVAGETASAQKHDDAGERTGRIAGIVTDANGNPLGDVTISVLTASQAPVRVLSTNADGRFEIDGLPRGRFELVFHSAGFARIRRAVSVPSAESEHVSVSLAIGPITDEITVTADAGQVQDRDETSQQVNVINERELSERATSTLAELANEEVGVSLQKTSPSIGGIFVRGMTGKNVVVYIDGVRYTTSAQREGINTFFNLIGTGSLRGAEILRGPNSAQYGSDSLAGTIHLISALPEFTPLGSAWHGQTASSFSTSDLGYGQQARLSYSSERFGMLLSGAARRANTIRIANDLDSHAAVTRFLGLPSNVLGGGRLTDTAFTQYGGGARLDWSPEITQQITLQYLRGHEDSGKRYDQLLGGDGNLIADLRNLMLDFLYGRYEKQRFGWFDSVSATGSFNSQREERVNQGGNGNVLGRITHQRERTSTAGLQLRGENQLFSGSTLALGAEYYREWIDAPAFTFDPVSTLSTSSRPRVPSGALYRSYGFYAQNVLDAIPSKLRLSGSVRYSVASYRARAEDSPIVNGRHLWLDDSLRADDVTFRVGGVYTITPGFFFSANVSRGFRTPNMTDLGTLGLTGNGFEVAGSDVARLGATVGDSVSSSARSTGRPVAPLKPETSWSYETSLRFKRSRVDTDITLFLTDLTKTLSKQALILPPGAIGLLLGDQSIVAQSPTGVVFVPATSTPVLVRTNLGSARFYGVEYTFALNMTESLSFSGNATYVHAADRVSGLPPSIEGGTPAPQVWLGLKYSPPSSRFWIEAFSNIADRQSRLSSLDLEDRRTGATRSRSSIASFFKRGAAARGLIGSGRDRVLGTSDDILLPTGETLAQVQDRILGRGVEEAPLFTAVPGYGTAGLRGGLRLAEKHEISVSFENMFDHSYRGISWGLDGAGRAFSTKYTFRF